MNASTLHLPAPAKLNLFLHITGRRPDGYHSLQTLFQLLDHGDTLQLTARPDGELRLRCEGPMADPGLPAEEHLVMRAALALRAEASESADLGADITLQKVLPAGGGLGGGSSDAATTLLGLNQLWKLNYSVDQLAAIARQLGADVPVFVRGKSAWAEGIGEELEPVDLPERWFLVVTPDCHISTQALFSHPQLTRDTPAITIAAFFAGQTRNDFQNLVRELAEPVDKALILLGNFGEAKMTGTGASVFVMFDSEAAATDAQGKLSELTSEETIHGWQSFVAKGLNQSPALDRLNKLRRGESRGQ
ncbi:MAG: 4-(cytidine 5'-diphospho)-2-C-methyl-D-erythritol kinase [Congregibacter sp.]